MEDWYVSELKSKTIFPGKTNDFIKFSLTVLSFKES